MGDDDEVAGRQHQSVAELAAQHLNDTPATAGTCGRRATPAMSCSASHSTVRCACPWPGTTMTTRRPSASQPRMSASAASVSPRYAGVGLDLGARTTRRRGRTARGPARRGRARGSRRERRRGCGTRPGRGRSAPRRRWRPPPTTPGGTPRWWRRGRGREPGSAPGRTDSTRSGGQQADQQTPCRRRARVPATPCPRRRDPPPASRTARPGRDARRPARGRAPRTSSVSSSSRHGGAHSVVDRIERALVGHREATDLLDASPKNSTRRGCSSVGGKTSTMPPRTANSPRRSTRSTRT